MQVFHTCRRHEVLLRLNPLIGNRKSVFRLLLKWLRIPDFDSKDRLNGPVPHQRFLGLFMSELFQLGHDFGDRHLKLVFPVFVSSIPTQITKSRDDGNLKMVIFTFRILHRCRTSHSSLGSNADHRFIRGEINPVPPILLVMLRLKISIL